MTNITLSIDDKTYQKMKGYSEIKWSEFVRKAIHARIEQLESIKDNESVLTMLASQQVLEQEWDNSYDERWDDV